MSPELKDLIRYRLDRARETLEEARLMLENQHLFAAMNRCYYSAFYIVSALLLTDGKSSSKHSGIRALFHQNVVHSGLVSQEWGAFYNQLCECRQKADYEDLVKLNTEQIKEWFDKTGVFMRLIEEIILRKLA
jgi:uncharacterized protein (UPF0332 family)